MSVLWNAAALFCGGLGLTVLWAASRTYRDGVLEDDWDDVRSAARFAVGQLAIASLLLSVALWCVR